MSFKPNLSRLARLEAGNRLSLPGQDPMREEELRIEFKNELQPKDRFEHIWIEDLAYRVAAIEVLRAQFAGFRTRVVRDLLEKLRDRAKEREDLGDNIDGVEALYGPDLSEAERGALNRWYRYGSVPTELTNRLGDPHFAWLLGNLDPHDMYMLRQFQKLEQEEVQERDRIIRQFERRRWQAVMDAVKLVEARYRVALLEGGEDATVAAPAEDSVDASGDARDEVNADAVNE